MNRSDSVTNLVASLIKVQAILEDAKKDSVNPFFNSKYADLSSVWDVCRQPLSDNGLCITQTLDSSDGGMIILETTLFHSSGEWINSRLLVRPVKEEPQAIGSAITYARRYALSALVGVCPEDDDAEVAQARPTGTGKGKKEAPPAKPAPDEATAEEAHWCEEHGCAFKKFTKGDESWYSHKDADGKWCNEAKKKGAPAAKSAPASDESTQDQVDMSWLTSSINELKWAGNVLQWLRDTYQANGEGLTEVVNNLTREQQIEFCAEVESRLDMLHQSK